MPLAAFTTGPKNRFNVMFTPCPVAAHAISPKALHEAKPNRCLNSVLSQTKRNFISFIFNWQYAAYIPVIITVTPNTNTAYSCNLSNVPNWSRNTISRPRKASPMLK